jgi:hypothetical protein
VKTGTINSRESLETLFRWMAKEVEQGKHISFAATDKCLEAVEFELEAKRTKTQNKSMHLLFAMTADQLNQAGMFVNVFPFKEGVEVEWTDRLVKKELWKPLQLAILGFDETSKLSTAQVNQVYEVYARAIAQKSGVSLEFPSMESLIYGQK